MNLKFYAQEEKAIFKSIQEFVDALPTDDAKFAIARKLQAAANLITNETLEHTDLDQWLDK